MTQTEFLQRILPELPPAGMFGRPECYFALSISGKIVKSEPCDSFDTITKYCNEASDANADAYMALASFNTPVMGRKQSNALAFKALRCDIDAGKKDSDGNLRPGVYEDARAGLAALVKAAQDFPPSIIVSSGMGLHVYWTFTGAVGMDKWAGLSNALLRRLQDGGLLVDAPKTTDIAAVLRLPGTKHQKTGRTVTVLAANADYPVEKLEQILGAEHEKPSVPSVPLVSSDDGFLAPAPKKQSAKQVVTGCNQMLTMGLGSYQQWFYGMCVLRRFDDGLDWAHKLSAMDDRYDKSGTDKKFMDASEDMPVLCATFQRDNPTGCYGCPHRGRLKSPVQLHNISQPQELSDFHTAAEAGEASSPEPAPATPAPVSKSPQEQGDRLVMPDSFTYERIPINSPMFTVDERGIVWHKTEKVNNQLETRDIIVCQSQLYYKHGVYQYSDERPIRGHIFEVVHPNGRVENVRFDVDSDMGDSVIKWFANANMYPTIGYNSGKKVYQDFMNAYLQSVVHSTKAKEVPTFNQFGWTKFADPENKAVTHSGFVIGKGVITAEGIRDARLDPKIETYGKKELTTAGSLEKWKEGVAMYKTLRQYIAQLAVCMATISPILMYGIGEAKSAVLSIWSSKSGMGKSHILRFASSAWGDPTQSFVSRMASVSLRGFKLGKFQNIPVFFDEMTDVSDNDMYGLAYTLTGGKEKDKMHSSGGQRIETGNWSTASFTTANKSFKSVIARKAGDSDATIQRIMEYECNFEDYSQMPTVTRYIDYCTNLIENNYGLAGPEFVYQLMKHEDWMQTIHPQAVNWIEKHKFSNDERFLSSNLALTIIGSRWAANEFGILPYDIDELEDWILSDFVPHNRSYTKEYAPDFKDMLANYLSERQPYTLVVAGSRRIGKTEEDPKTKGLPDQFIISLPQREIYIRFEQREKRLLISRSDLTSWLRKMNVSYATFKKRLEMENIHTAEYPRRLGSSISWMSDGNIFCLVLDREALEALGVNTDNFKEGEDGLAD